MILDTNENSPTFVGLFLNLFFIGEAKVYFWT